MKIASSSRRCGSFLAATVGAFTLLGALLLGCQRPPPTLPEAPAGPDWFADVTAESGLDFVHDAGPLGTFSMIQIVGSGAAVFDFDGDGLLDLLLLNNGGPNGRPNALYRQVRGGKFVNVSAGSGVDFPGFNMGVAVGDVNNDGLPDLLITQYGGVRLLLNQGSGKFKDVTKEAGLDNPSWGASASFLDFDGDGWLDLVVVNYVDYDPGWRCTAPSGERDYCAPKVFAGTVTRLFRNLGRVKGKGPMVRFEDVTVPSGLARATGPGLGVLCADFDGDGWPDIFVANDGKPNHLWINQRNGTFKEEALARGVAVNTMGQAQAGMGVALADVDGDGLDDLFITHLVGETNTLWRQGPRGLYQDRTGLAGLARPLWRATGFGTALADLTCSGWPDIVVVNGRVSRGSEGAAPHLGEHWSHYAERNQLFINDGKGFFRDASLEQRTLCATANVARGLARGSLNNDGGIDLLLTCAGGRARLLRNVAPRGHWLLVRPLLPVDNGRRRDALGAEVHVRAAGRTWRRYLTGSDSYLCSSDPRAHFGLGSHAQVEWIEVRWPDGPRERERFAGGAADREVVVVRGQGEPVGKR
jgi:hypothetical protein